MKLLKKIIKYLTIVVIVALVAVGLASTVRGVPGSPDPITIYNTLRSEGKPFELSSERSRYALAMSIVDNHSLQFTKDVAALALPDLGTIHGKFVSLFAPGVSYAIIPLYILGEKLHNAQVITFATSAVFAFFNFILIAIIVKKLTGNVFAGLLGGLTFVFGTTAWAYSATLYEHHYSVFLLLLATLLTVTKNNFIKNFFIGILFGLAIFVEYPGGVFFVPLILWLLSKHLEIKDVSEKIKVSFSFSIIWLVIGFAIGIAPTFIYNKEAYGNPLQLAGTVSSIRTFEKLDSPPKTASTKTASGFFKVEKLPQGLDVLVTSKDRGVLIFSPVILLGLLGLWVLRKHDESTALGLFGVVLATLILFSLWGDPWGGYGFGPRYLIPAFAFLGIGIGVAINKFRNNFIFSIVFFTLFIYSTAVSLTGALTTLQIPPSSDPVSASLPAYTYMHNRDLLQQGITGSFVYNTYFRNLVTLPNFELYIFLSVLVMAVISYVGSAE